MTNCEAQLQQAEATILRLRGLADNDWRHAKSCAFVVDDADEDECDCGLSEFRDALSSTDHKEALERTHEWCVLDSDHIGPCRGGVPTSDTERGKE